MTYLSEPCPRCHKKELQQPIKNKNRMYSKCATCGRKSLFVIHHKVGGSKSYSIVQVGTPGRAMVRATFWIEKWHNEIILWSYFAGQTLVGPRSLRSHAAQWGKRKSRVGRSLLKG